MIIDLKWRVSSFKDLTTWKQVKNRFLLAKYLITDIEKTYEGKI